MSMLLQVTIFLGAALILVPLGKRFGIATVLGYLFTGILLGPSVLNIANDSESIMSLAEYGVIMLMFLIGLELRPQRLWQMRQAIFVMGGLQMAVTGTVLMLLIFVLFKFSLSVSFVVGFAFALSSTAFVMQLLRDRKQTKSYFGQQAFAVLLFQDIAAMVLLAVIPLLTGQDSAHHGIAYFAAVVATFSGLFLFSRYILRPLFRFVAKSGATELLTAVGLFIVLGVVVLMDAIGISTTLGAFLTGVLLADSEFRHELESNIQPFKGLLLGLFFMTVGMGVSLHVLVDQPLLILGGTLILMLIKMLCVVGIALFRKQSFANSLRLGVALAQGGEFAFVVFGLAAAQKMIGHTELVSLTLMVTLSMILTPTLFWLLDHVFEPRFAKQDATREFDDFADVKTHIRTSDHPSHIVVAGFGRIGQIVSRIAHVHRVPFTAIDNNIDQIDFVRKYGGKVYYGDPTLPEILKSAGVGSAKMLILAVDDTEDSMNIARHVRMHYPHLPILARARDRHHVHLLRDLGVKYIWRETYHSALAMAEHMLVELGQSVEHAKQNVQFFQDYDQGLLQRQQGIYADPQKMMESNREMLNELRNLFENDQFVQPPTSKDLTATSSDSAQDFSSKSSP